MQVNNGASDVWRGAAAGAVGGALGSTAMVVFNHLLARTGLGGGDLGRHHRRRRVDAKPNDSDGTIADEPATRKAASQVSEAVIGRQLNEDEKGVGGAIVHHLFGALTGALYGAVSARVPVVAAGAGIPYGILVWVAAAEAGVPLTGLSKAPTEYPPARHAASFATHVIFGATLECVRRSLTPVQGVDAERGRLRPTT